MLYLYLGFLIAQSFSVFKVLYNAHLPLLAVAFSITVFLIWTFVPILGYLAAKLTGAKPHYHSLSLFLLGLAVCLFEKLLFHFNLLTTTDGFLPMLVTGSCFFIIAYLPFAQKAKPVLN
jgi:hypothetical protein